MASPTELAREAMEHSRGIRNEFDLLKQLVKLHDLPGLNDRFIGLNHRIDVLETTVAVRTAVLETRLAELERCKQEADKRQWQFVYIFAGGMATLLVTAVVQLLISVIKK